MQRRDFGRILIPGMAAAGTLLQAADIPRDAPDLVISMPNGRAPMKLSQFKGKVIGLEFILTYCSHCQRASRTSDIIYREYGPKGFQPIAAAINPGADTMAYVRDLNLTFPVGTVSQEACTSFMQHPAMLRLLMPQMAFIDRNFKVTAQYSGDAPFFGETEEKNMRDLLDKLLKPAGGAAPAKKATGKKS